MNEKGTALAARIEASLAEVDALRAAIAAAPPLPDAARLGPDEEAWGGARCSPTSPRQ